MPRTLHIIVILISFTPVAHAGHSRHPYFDGGQSADGRYVVTVKLVTGEPGAKNQPAPYHWAYRWKDTKTGETIDGKLAPGYRTGNSAVFDPVHGHVFAAPDGQTFAVWNPQVLAPCPNKSVPKDFGTPEAREFAGFSHRLVIYKKSGEVVKRLDLKDLLTDAEWNALYCYGCQVYWQLEYVGMHTRNAPRPGYALYRISPDYTVLETTIGANQEATYKLKEKGITPPEPRVLRISLLDGSFLPADQASSDPNKIPGRPFTGELADKENHQKAYVPSLDPVRVPGKYVAE